MSDVSLHPKSSAQPSLTWLDSPATRWHKPVFIVFLLWCAGLLLALVLEVRLLESWEWTEGTLFLFAAVSSLIALNRRLPVQNVIAAAAIVGLLSTAIHAFSLRTGIPFGSQRFTENLGYRWFGTLPWPLPFLWITTIVASRGIARLIMRPYRKLTYYGFWVIGLTAMLAIVFDAGLEPFATQVKRYWVWETPPRTITWHSAPWTNFLGWGLTATLLLAVSTPWLLNKQPVKQPTDYHGLAVWVALQSYFAVGNLAQGRWGAAALILSAVVGVSFFAIRGARW